MFSDLCHSVKALSLCKLTKQVTIISSPESSETHKVQVQIFCNLICVPKVLHSEWKSLRSAVKSCLQPYISGSNQYNALVWHGPSLCLYIDPDTKLYTDKRVLWRTSSAANIKHDKLDVCAPLQLCRGFRQSVCAATHCLSRLFLGIFL